MSLINFGYRPYSKLTALQLLFTHGDCAIAVKRVCSVVRCVNSEKELVHLCRDIYYLKLPWRWSQGI